MLSVLIEFMKLSLFEGYRPKSQNLCSDTSLHIRVFLILFCMGADSFGESAKQIKSYRNF